MKSYCLEIYEPESFEDVLAVVESDHPLAQISKGDLIHPRSFSRAVEHIWPDHLRVVEVEHIFFGEPIKHKICVYTRRVSPGNLRTPESELSKRERFVLAKILRILEILDPREASVFAEHRQALEEGYELHYSWIFDHFYDGMSVDACKEVLDILDMYRAISFSAREFEDEDFSDTHWYPFPGFDGNNETSQVGYTRYFVHTLGRFQELAEHGEHSDFNSHMRSLPKYRAMLRAWVDEFDRSHSLNSEQIRSLLSAEKA